MRATCLIEVRKEDAPKRQALASSIEVALCAMGARVMAGKYRCSVERVPEGYDGANPVWLSGDELEMLGTIATGKLLGDELSPAETRMWTAVHKAYRDSKR